MTAITVELQQKHFDLLQRFADEAEVKLEVMGEIFLTHELIKQALSKGWINARPEPWKK